MEQNYTKNTPVDERMKRVADINAEVARQGNKDFSVAPSAPSYVPPTTINSSSLVANRTPLTIPTPPMGTSNADLNALLATTASQTKADALAEQTRLAQETAKTEADTSKKGLYDTFLQKIGIQQTKGAVQQEFGVADKTQKVTDLTTQLDALDKAQLDEIRSLDQQPGTLAQKQQRISDISYKYNQRKADIAILQSAANRDLATASALAEAKINTQLEPLNTKIEFMSMFYQDNKDQLSKAEQNQFNVALQDAQAERTQKATELKTLSDTKLEILKNIYAYAPPEVANQLAKNVQMAGSVEQVISAGGQYGGDVLDRKIKEAQLAKTQAEAVKAKRDLEPGTGSDAPLYNGLTSTTATAVRSIVSGFKSEPQLTNFATIQDGYNFTQMISNDTKNPADDQALVYALAKALDPGSVVREGEYATAQKYAQSWVKAYGKSVTQAVAGTGFLSKEARENIKKVIETKYTSSKKSYDNLYGQYAKQINNLTGRDDGTKFLRDYAVETTNGTQTVKSNGQEWVVGQIYNDGTANWVVDAQGNWSKQ